jgi:hypothetical protein
MRPEIAKLADELTACADATGLALPPSGAYSAGVQYISH